MLKAKARTLFSFSTFGTLYVAILANWADPLENEYNFFSFETASGRRKVFEALMRFLAAIEATMKGNEHGNAINVNSSWVEQSFHHSGG